KKTEINHVASIDVVRRDVNLSQIDHHVLGDWVRVLGGRVLAHFLGSDIERLLQPSLRDQWLAEMLEAERELVDSNGGVCIVHNPKPLCKLEPPDICLACLPVLAGEEIEVGSIPPDVPP